MKYHGYIIKLKWAVYLGLINKNEQRQKISQKLRKIERIYNLYI